MMGNRDLRCWLVGLLGITFLIQVTVASKSYCVREGHCVILECPYLRGFPPEGEPGPIHTIRWNLLDDPDTKYNKRSISGTSTYGGYFLENSDGQEVISIEQNGDLRILAMERSFQGNYSCAVYTANAGDARSNEPDDKPKIQLNFVSKSDDSPPCQPQKNPCQKDVGDRIPLWGKIVAGVFGGMVLILLVLCIFSCVNKCCAKKLYQNPRDLFRRQESQLEEPKGKSPAAGGRTSPALSGRSKPGYTAPNGISNGVSPYSNGSQTQLPYTQGYDNGYSTVTTAGYPGNTNGFISSRDMDPGVYETIPSDHSVSGRSGVSIVTVGMDRDSGVDSLKGSDRQL